MRAEMEEMQKNSPMSGAQGAANQGALRCHQTVDIMLTPPSYSPKLRSRRLDGWEVDRKWVVRKRGKEEVRYRTHQPISTVCRETFLLLSVLVANPTGPIFLVPLVPHLELDSKLQPS